jgi:hypothetical protein
MAPAIAISKLLDRAVDESEAFDPDHVFEDNYYRN